ncbi:hypothetical protein ACFSCW_03280 [Sphingomonas tabacisoli]|uniref:Uncharacterized protein n=1 Tax=Sphingomonas tabacisoli TaxID=2249466 RepID=A0ABW4I190_9SPHN
MMKLNFLLAGNIGRVVEMEQAICLALYDRPSADAEVFVHATTGETMIRMPWKTEEEAQRATQLGVVGRGAILKALQNAYLTTYVQNPQSGAYHVVPRWYWRDRDLIGLEASYLGNVDNATGFDITMVGQPLVVPMTELEDWKEQARPTREFVSSLNLPTEASPNESAQALAGNPRPPKSPSKDACMSLAATLDDEGIPIRRVGAELIASRWNLEHGPVPKKEAVTVHMTGQPKGRRSKAG